MRMPKTIIKTAFSISVIFTIVSCSNTVPNNNLILNQENFQGFSNEYNFSTKELTESYLRRKIDTLLDIVNGGVSINGTLLVKEIAYGKVKHPALLCAVLGEDNNNRLEILNTVDAVNERKSVDSAFSNFLENCSVSSLLHDEFRVNAYTTGAQYQPVIAMDDSGDFVVAWGSYGQDGENYEIFARRYTSTGQPTGPELHVNTYTTSSQVEPAVAMDSDGDFIVSWQSYIQDSSNYGVFAQRYNSDGSPNGSEFQVNTFIDGAQKNTSVAMDNNGDFVITWSSYDDGFGDIFARRYDSFGNPGESTEFQVNNYNTNRQYTSAVAMDGDGDFVVTWGSLGQDGEDYGIFAQKFNNNGTLFGTEFQVNTYFTNSQFLPAVAMDNAGDFVISWTSINQDGDYHGIYAQRYGSTGAPAGTEFRVNTWTTGYQLSSTVAMDFDGDFIISWHSANYGIPGQDGDLAGIFAQRYNSDGNINGTEFQVNIYTTDSQINPVVAADNAGDFVVVWNSYYHDDDYYYGVYARRYNSP
jgi:hypothetical protein